jgi:hypothetical protein
VHITPELIIVSNTTIAESEPLFSSAEAAMRWAVNFERPPDRPAMNRAYESPISDGILPPSRGLSGENGAIQAGYITRAMGTLGAIPCAILTARVVKKRIECSCRRPCCSRSMMNPGFRAQLNQLADEVWPLLTFRKQRIGHQLCFDLVNQTFDTKNKELEAVALADKYGISDDTIGKLNGKIKLWLFGHRGNGKIRGIENDAWRDIESVLRQACTNDGAPIVG